MRIRTMTWTARCGLSVWSVACLACSSNTTIVNSNCGPGTVLVDGACVPADSGTADAPKVDSPVSDGADAANPDVDADTADGIPADVPLDASLDDPCPTAKIDVNCAKDCGGTTSTCALAKCHDESGSPPSAPYVKVTDLSKPFIMRTPSRPSADPACQPRCGAGNTLYGMAVRVELPFTSYGWRALVGPPWKIASFEIYKPWCVVTTAAVSACRYEPTRFAQIEIVTLEADAPARNVVIESVGSGVTCP